MTDIHELFNRDPLTMGSADIKEIISYLRERRHQFNAGNLTAGKMKAPKTSEVAKDLVGKLELKL